MRNDSVALNVAALVTYGRCRLSFIELRLIAAEIGLSCMALIKDWKMQKSSNKMEEVSVIKLYFIRLSTNTGTHSFA